MMVILFICMQINDVEGRGMDLLKIYMEYFKRKLTTTILDNVQLKLLFNIAIIGF